MARQKKIIWAYLFPKEKRPGENILQKSIYIHKLHPKWNFYILLEGEPEDWGFEKYNSGYRLYSYEFLHINPDRGNDKTGSRNKSDMGKNSGNIATPKTVFPSPERNFQTMNLTPEKYCEFLSKLPLTTRKWSSIEPPKTKSGRKKLLKKYGPYAFLDPENLKYPIISRKGEFSPKGLLAAYKRARQWGDDKIAELAEQIGKCMGLSWAILNPSQIQSILFDRDYWTLKEAREWLKEHGFEYHNYERTPNYYRFPQQKPQKFIRFRTKDFGNGIKAIIGFKDLISNPEEPYNSNMTVTYTELYKKYLEEGEKLLKEKDYVQASEKFWGAAAEITKAVASKMGKTLRTHGDLFRFIRDLDKKRPSLRLSPDFGIASYLHQNFYENHLPPETVEEFSKIVKQFIRKMKKFLK